MTCTVTTTEQGSVRIEGELCVFHAEIVKPQLIDALDSGNSEFAIDLAGVSEIDTAGLQLLLLAKREVERGGRGLRFVNHSEPVRQVLELTGLASEFSEELL